MWKFHCRSSLPFENIALQLMSFCLWCISQYPLGVCLCCHSYISSASLNVLCWYRQLDAPHHYMECARAHACGDLTDKSIFQLLSSMQHLLVFHRPSQGCMPHRKPPLCFHPLPQHRGYVELGPGRGWEIRHSESHHQGGGFYTSLPHPPSLNMHS